MRFFNIGRKKDWPLRDLPFRYGRMKRWVKVASGLRYAYPVLVLDCEPSGRP